MVIENKTIGFSFTVNIMNSSLDIGKSAICVKTENVCQL